MTVFEIFRFLFRFVSRSPHFSSLARRLINSRLHVHNIEHTQLLPLSLQHKMMQIPNCQLSSAICFRELQWTTLVVLATRWICLGYHCIIRMTISKQKFSSTTVSLTSRTKRMKEVRQFWWLAQLRTDRQFFKAVSSGCTCFFRGLILAVNLQASSINCLEN